MIASRELPTHHHSCKWGWGSEQNVFGNLENGKGVARQNRNQATQKFERLASTEITLCGKVGMIQIPCKLIDVPKVASVHCSEYVVFILIHFWYLVFLIYLQFYQSSNGQLAMYSYHEWALRFDWVGTMQSLFSEPLGILIFISVFPVFVYVSFSLYTWQNYKPEITTGPVYFLLFLVEVVSAVNILPSYNIGSA